jgi:hypothetical protein
VLTLEDYPKAGLYLTFKDNNCLQLDHDQIEEYSAKFLNDPANVPESVKKAADFEACSICPLRDTGEFCHALRPVLPFLEVVDRYFSYDPVTAVYRSCAGMISAVETTMQSALMNISILSLIGYCNKGKEYWKFFYGVHPLMPSQEVVCRVYLNVFWQFRGREEGINEWIEEFRSSIAITSDCQVKRLRLICKKDAVLNAFARTQILSEFLFVEPEILLQAAFQKFSGQSDL